MARIAGVNIPDNKRVEVGLTHIYGVGHPGARQVLAAAQVDPSKRGRELSEEEVARLREAIDKNYRVEGELKRIVSENIKRLKQVGSYRGIRHQRGLPVRGQRTRTNARTRKGKKRTIGVLIRKSKKGKR